MSQGRSSEKRLENVRNLLIKNIGALPMSVFHKMILVFCPLGGPELYPALMNDNGVLETCRNLIHKSVCPTCSARSRCWKAFLGIIWLVIEEVLLGNSFRRSVPVMRQPEEGQIADKCSLTNLEHSIVFYLGGNNTIPETSLQALTPKPITIIIRNIWMVLYNLQRVWTFICLLYLQW